MSFFCRFGYFAVSQLFTLKNSISPKFKTAIFAISPKFGGALASDFRQISEILPPISDKSIKFAL